MLRIVVFSQSRYPADKKRLKEKIKSVLRYRGVSDGVVSLALVGERKIKDLAKRYLKEENKIHEILSFPASDPARPDDFILPAEVNQLGDIVICYPEARSIAMKKNRMVDDVLCELAEHGTLHILGVHHDV